MSDTNLVYLKCFPQGSKLRVRITSPGYNNYANCQFPRDVRVAGRKYSVPADAVKFARGPAGKFFYRIAKKFVTVLDESTTNEAESVPQIAKIFEESDPDCVVCMAEEHDVVFAPCGHYCCCNNCANTLKTTSGKCPMCRNNITEVVPREMIQLA